MIYLWIAIGGALGAVCRYSIANESAIVLGQHFPIGTLLVNVLGSLCIGFCAVLILHKTHLAPWLRPLVMIGFFGALTTFSSFALETLQLWQTRAIGITLLNIALNMGLSLSAVLIGSRLGSVFFP